MSAAQERTGHLLRVVRGDAGPEEIAAVTAVVLAVLARAETGAEPGGDARSRVRWRRPERQMSFSPSRSWSR